MFITSLDESDVTYTRNRRGWMLNNWMLH